jgi:hypothetical protein
MVGAQREIYLPLLKIPLAVPNMAGVYLQDEPLLSLHHQTIIPEKLAPQRCFAPTQHDQAVAVVGIG